MCKALNSAPQNAGNCWLSNQGTNGRSTPEVSDKPLEGKNSDVERPFVPGQRHTLTDLDDRTAVLQVANLQGFSGVVHVVPNSSKFPQVSMLCETTLLHAEMRFDGSPRAEDVRPLPVLREASPIPIKLRIGGPQEYLNSTVGLDGFRCFWLF